MPAIARYESWKLTDDMIPGLIASCIINAVHRTDVPSALRPHIFAVSLIRMNRKALTIEADAPVMTVKRPAAAIIVADLVFCIAGEFPASDNARDNMM